MEVDYRLIAESAEDSIYILDRDCNVTYVNTYGATMMGGSPEMIVGQNISNLFPPDAAAHHKKNVSKVFKSGKPFYSESSSSFENRMVWLSTRLIPIHDNKGIINAVLGVSRDITDLKTKQQELENHQRLLEERLRHATILNRLGRVLMEEEDGNKLIKCMAEGVGQALEVDAAHVYRIGLEKNEGALIAEWLNPKKPFMPMAKDYDLSKLRDVIQKTLETGTPIISYADKTDPRITVAGDSMNPHIMYGIESFMCYPFDIREDSFNILTLSVASEQRHWTDEEMRLVDSLTNQITVAFMEANMLATQKSERQVLKENHNRLENMLDGTVKALAAAAERKDPFTAGHQRHVVQLAVAIARDMRLSEEKVAGIRIAATVHDFGKIYIPAEILSKPAALTDFEFAIVETHSQYGFDILKTIEFPWPVAQIVFQHHEMLDGSGYPLGIKGDDICVEARILAVADGVEAMLHHRPYKELMNEEEMIKDLHSKSGKMYDAAVVDSCVKLFKSKKFKFTEDDA